MSKIEKLFLKIYASFVKKEQTYLIFESADSFFDNAYALYLYIKKNFPEYKLLYVTASKEQEKSGPSHGVSKKEMINCRKKLKLYRYSLKAKCIFFSYENYWRKLKLQPETRVVYTAHGEFPVKDCTKYYNFLFGEPQENKLDIIVRTEYAKQIIDKKYPIFSKHNEVIAGMPRSDEMFHADLDKKFFLEKLGVKEFKDQSLIVSMTTFRHQDARGLSYFEEEFPINLNNEELAKLNDILCKNNQILLIKLHHCQDGVIIPPNMDNIYFVSNKFLVDLNISNNILYTICDSLITDYSSAYLSFLDLDRKVGFVLIDQDKYTSSRGYTLDNVEDMMPGDKMRTKEDLYKFFDDLASKNDPYKEQRRDVKLKFTGDYKDQNCKSYTDIYLSK